MVHGLEVRDDTGAITFDSTDTTIRLIDSWELTTQTGSRAVPGVTPSNGFVYLMGTRAVQYQMPKNQVTLNNESVSWEVEDSDATPYYILVFRNN